MSPPIRARRFFIQHAEIEGLVSSVLSQLGCGGDAEKESICMVNYPVCRDHWHPAIPSAPGLFTIRCLFWRQRRPQRNYLLLRALVSEPPGKSYSTFSRTLLSHQRNARLFRFVGGLCNPVFDPARSGFRNVLCPGDRHYWHCFSELLNLFHTAKPGAAFQSFTILRGGHVLCL